MLLRAALSFAHGSYSEMLGSSETRLKQQLVGRADAKLGLAGSRADFPAVFAKSCALLESISLKLLELCRRACVICSWKRPDSDQVLL